MILYAALASRAENQDPIDLAVLGGLKEEQELKSYQVLRFQPFDPVHKRTEAEVKGGDGKSFKVAKGAPQVILDLASPSPEIRKQVEEAVGMFAAKGYRALGTARIDETGQWQILGVIPLFDPPREDSESTIETAKQLGVKVKMITGDQVAIAKEISDQLKLGPNVLDASLFGDTKHHETGQLAEAIETADGFAQVFPEHKYHA